MNAIYQVCDGVSGWEDVDLTRYAACCLRPEEYFTRVLYSVPFAAPDGWKLVPVEPTAEMVNAFKGRVAVTNRGGLLNTGHALCAAIQAAPEHPACQS